MLDASAELVFDFDRSPTDSDSAILGGVAYFAASDLEGDVELWKSDGTAGGTVLVKDVRIGRGSSMPSSITAADGRIYFLLRSTTTRGGNCGFRMEPKQGRFG